MAVACLSHDRLPRRRVAWEKCVIGFVWIAPVMYFRTGPLNRVLTSLENLEISGNFVNLENSRYLKCTQGFFGAHYYRRQKCRPMTLVSENITFMQIFAGVPLGGGDKRHSTLCKKYAKMTATVILYIVFLLYSCL